MPDAYDHISLICRLKATQTKNKNWNPVNGMLS